MDLQTKKDGWRKRGVNRRREREGEIQQHQFVVEEDQRLLEGQDGDSLDLQENPFSVFVVERRLGVLFPRPRYHLAIATTVVASENQSRGESDGRCTQFVGVVNFRLFLLPSGYYFSRCFCVFAVWF